MLSNEVICYSLTDFPCAFFPLIHSKFYPSYIDSASPYSELNKKGERRGEQMEGKRCQCKDCNRIYIRVTKCRINREKQHMSVERKN